MGDTFGVGHAIGVWVDEVVDLNSTISGVLRPTGDKLKATSTSPILRAAVAATLLALPAASLACPEDTDGDGLRDALDNCALGLAILSSSPCQPA